jgi:putative DNA primase/helicase
VQQSKPKTADEAVGRWPGILQTLGIDSRYLSNKHGPCPVCQGKDRYRFDDKDGRGKWICSHCGSGDGFALLRQVYGWSFADAAKQVDRIIGTVPVGPIAQARTEESKMEALRAAWKASKPVSKGDPVWLYLHQTRRLGIDMAPADIRLHPGMKHSEGGTYPVMLATMRYPDGTAASIHRTYLTADGQKAPVEAVKKFMQGKPLQTSAVRLGALGRRLGIAEGIETALAASQRFGLPVWAATNAVLLEAWVPPADVEHVLIACDNDASYTGQAAAFALARRLVRDGYAVEVQIPDGVGKDWADAGI